jgi:hypothetical protein
MRKPASRSRLSTLLHEDVSRPVAGGSNDSRDGLGYGILQPRFHKPQSMGADFPYSEPDMYDDMEEPDEETAIAVRNKTLNFGPTDSIPQKGLQPFYFAEGRRFLADCFWDVNEVLIEIAAFGEALTPGNNNYASTERASFPYPGGGGSNYKRTGTRQGWSRRPPLSRVAAADISDEEIAEEEIYSLRDLAKKEEESPIFAR